MGAPNSASPVIIKRKKVTGGDGHHGGAWKVAYADFVTAMMAFFMLMWLLNATTEQQRKGLADYFAPSVPIARVSGGGDGSFGGDSIFSEDVMPQSGTGASAQVPTEYDRAKGDVGLIQQDNALEEVEKKVEEALMGLGGESIEPDDVLKHVVTRVTDEGVVVEFFDLDDRPLFDANNEPQPILESIAALIASVASQVDNALALEAHTASQPLVLADNPVWRVSTARANAVRTLFEARGVEAGRTQRVTGHADREPAVADPMAIRNNRIEVIFLRDDN